MRRSATALALCALVLSSCSQLPPRSGLPYLEWPSPNFEARRPGFVILHHTGSATVQRALSVLSDPARKVSAHYVIARDGTIYYLVDELARAWHAGVSYWGGNRDINSSSIGIELDNDGKEPFSEPQIAALLALLADLRERYEIPASNFLGHADVAPRRKADPGPLFPWRRLAEHGFGLWCDPPYPPPPAADGATLLAAFGYDTSSLESAIAAFKLHFAPHDTSPVLEDEHRGLLQCLIDKRRAAE